MAAGTNLHLEKANISIALPPHPRKFCLCWFLFYLRPTQPDINLSCIIMHRMFVGVPKAYLWKLDAPGFPIPWTVKNSVKSSNKINPTPFGIPKYSKISIAFHGFYRCQAAYSSNGRCAASATAAAFGGTAPVAQRRRPSGVASSCAANGRNQQLVAMR